MVKALEVPTNTQPTPEQIASAAVLPDRPTWWAKVSKRRSVQWARAQHWLRFSDNHPSSSPGYRTSYVQEIAGAVATGPAVTVWDEILSPVLMADIVLAHMLRAQADRMGQFTHNGVQWLNDADVAAEANEVAQADDVTHYIPTHPGTEPNDKAIDARGREWAHDRSDGFGRDGFEFLGFTGPDLRTDPDRPPNNLVGGRLAS